MEQLPPDHANKCYNAGTSSGGTRQSSTRWSPTTEQIRILKELYYNNGVRSPTADQIQRISAKLRQYGKIEGKNVFYWFQNHKARERQKKRFTTTAAATHDIYMRPPPPPMPHHMYYNNKFTPPPPGGLLGNYSYHQQLSAPPQNFPWSSGFDPYSSSEQTLEMEMEVGEGEEEEEEERETLPLFPIHGDMIKVQQQQQGSSEYGYNGSNCFSATSSRASLELSLSSSYSYM